MLEAGRRAAPVARPVRLVAVTLGLIIIAAGCASGATGGARTSATAAAGAGADATTTTTRPLALGLLDAACAATLQVENAANVTGSSITEASGIAASRVNPGTWWVHNDSGDSARFFLVDAGGTVRTTATVGGATAQDWEDIAVGPPVDASGANSVYLADIGDNAGQRANIVVYRATEPTVTPDAVGATTSVAADKLTLTYPDGAHDAEALMVDPWTGELVIVTKDWSLAGESGVYRAPAGLAAGSTTVLERVATLALPAGTLVTAADVSPDGGVVALRSYGAIALYPRAAGQPLWSAFTATPCAGPRPDEKQGEAIGFAADGGSYATISEGTDPVLHLTVPSP